MNNNNGENQVKTYDLMPKPLSIEARLLLCCLQTHPEQTIITHIRHFLRQPLDQDLVLKMAEKHRVVPLFYRGLKRAEDGVLDDLVWLEAGRIHKVNAQRNFRLAHHATRLLKAFRQHNIPVIAYKGVFMARDVYGQISDREVGDIDLLLSLQNLEEATKLLRSLGFVLNETLDQECVYQHAEYAIEVDLHWRLTPAFFRFEAGFEFFAGRCRQVDWGGTAVLALAAEDLLIVLCLQVAKDCWERQQRIEHLAKVCDIAELLHSEPSLDWAATLERSKALGVERIVHFALLLAIDLLDAPVPAKLEAQFKSDGVAQALAKQVCASLLTPRDRTSPAHNSLFDVRLRAKQLRFYLRMRERSSDRLHHLFHLLGVMLTLGNQSNTR